MKPGQVMLGLLIGATFGVLVGWFFARGQARVDVMSGPYSDNFDPALEAIAQTREKLQSGDTNVFEHLNAAQAQIQRAQKWTEWFLGQPDGAANGSQPIRSQTNQTSPAAGSRR